MLKAKVRQAETVKVRKSPTKAPRKRSANDNKKTKLSGFTWRKQAAILKRMSDLEWQINFAEMKLKRWHALDNGQWSHLKDMQTLASAELTRLRLKPA